MKKILLIIFSIILLLIAFFMYKNKQNNQINIEAIKVGKVDIIKTLQVSGIIKAYNE